MKHPNGRCVSGALIECCSLAGCRHYTPVTKFKGTSTEVGYCMDQADRTVAPTFRWHSRRFIIRRVAHRTILHRSAPARCWAVIDFSGVKDQYLLAWALEGLYRLAINYRALEPSLQRAAKTARYFFRSPSLEIWFWSRRTIRHKTEPKCTLALWIQVFLFISCT